jgi:hypothetical protein
LSFSLRPLDEEAAREYAIDADLLEKLSELADRGDESSAGKLHARNCLLTSQEMV